MVNARSISPFLVEEDATPLIHSCRLDVRLFDSIVTHLKIAQCDLDDPKRTTVLIVPNLASIS